MTLGSGFVIVGGGCVYWYASVSTATSGKSADSDLAIWLTARMSGPIGLPSAWITLSSSGSLQ